MKIEFSEVYKYTQKPHIRVACKQDKKLVGFIYGITFVVRLFFSFFTSIGIDLRWFLIRAGHDSSKTPGVPVPIYTCVMITFLCNHAWYRRKLDVVFVVSRWVGIPKSIQFARFVSMEGFLRAFFVACLYVLKTFYQKNSKTRGTKKSFQFRIS